MQNSKKRTIEEWERDVYIYYLQSVNSFLIPWEVYLEQYAKKGDSRLEKAIGYKYEEVINQEEGS